MKLRGQKISGPNVETIVIPRGNGEDIIFKAQAVMDLDQFDKLCPLPKPPMVMKPGGTQIPDYNDSAYKISIDQHGNLRLAWMIIQSLKATEDLEWETVDYNDPNTWLKWRRELIDSGFSLWEITRIENGVLTANCLNENKIEEARQRFILTQVLPQKE